MTKTTEDSRVEIVIPFSKDLSLRSQYVSSIHFLRMGKIMEDLDAVAAYVAILHLDDGDPTTRVKKKKIFISYFIC